MFARPQIQDDAGWSVPAWWFGVMVVLACVALVMPRSAHSAARHAQPRATPSSIDVGRAGQRQITGMNFVLGAPAQVRAIVVRDGAFVRRLSSGRMRRGHHRLTWDGVGAGGIVVSPGAYTIAVSIFRPGSRPIAYRSAVTVLASSSTPIDSGMLVWPVDGAVTSPFGLRGTRNHDGIDIVAAAGTPIVAAAGGRVVSAGSMQGYGLTVVIEHDTTGQRTLYAHQSRLGTTTNQVVVSGQVIGYVGQTGVADGDHLHFELRGKDGRAVDPLPSLPAPLANA